MAAFTFRKAERLSKKKLIDQLFASGRSFFIYPYKVVWLLIDLDQDQPYPAQVLITASKKAMRMAVARNRVKRQTRELYRLQKHLLYDLLLEMNRHALIGIVFTANEIMPHDQASEKIKQVVERLLKEFGKQLNG